MSQGGSRFQEPKSTFFLLHPEGLSRKVTQIDTMTDNMDVTFTFYISFDVHQQKCWAFATPMLSFCLYYATSLRLCNYYSEVNNHTSYSYVFTIFGQEKFLWHWRGSLFQSVHVWAQSLIPSSIECISSPFHNASPTSLPFYKGAPTVVWTLGLIWNFLVRIK